MRDLLAQQLAPGTRSQFLSPQGLAGLQVETQSDRTLVHITCLRLEEPEMPGAPEGRLHPAPPPPPLALWVWLISWMCRPPSLPQAGELPGL